MSDRRNSSTRGVHEAEVDDIIGIFDVLDTRRALRGTTFVAADLGILPKFGPEEINPAAIAERQARTDAAIENISATVQRLADACTATETTADHVSSHSAVHASLVDMQRKFDEFTISMNARVDQLNAVCANIQSTNASSERGVQPDLHPTDRRSNIIIFGIKEDRDATVWRRQVDAALHYVTDHAFDVIDMFRLGRYDANKTRPVLVKLRVAWDKRLILSKCSKLKNYEQRGIFITPDEPLDVRRKQTLDRLKYRAERAGESVVVNDGVLFIGGVPKFSLTDGFIHNNHD